MSQSAHPHSLPPGDVQLLDDLKDAYMNKRLREFLNHHTSHDLVNVIDLPIQDHSNVLYLLCREKFGNNHEDIELLIQRGAKVTLPYPRHKISMASSALHIAVWRLDVDLVAFLRSHGASLTCLNSENDLPIHDARVKTKHRRDDNATELMQALAYKVALNILPSDMLHHVDDARRLCQKSALDASDETELECLLEKRPELWKAPVSPSLLDSPKVTWTCLHVACAMGNWEALTILLDVIQRHKMQPKICEMRDSDGWNPLHCLVARMSYVHVFQIQEEKKLVDMAEKLLSVFPDFATDCTFHRDDPWEHRLFQIMWERTDTTTTPHTPWRLYCHTRLPGETDTEERFECWVWKGNKRLDCIVNFLPRNARRLRMSHATTKELQLVKEVIDQLYVDEFRGVLRTYARDAHDNTPPDDATEIVFRVSPTLLLLTDPIFHQEPFKIANTNIAFTGLQLKRIELFTEKEFVEEYEGTMWNDVQDAVTVFLFSNTRRINLYHSDNRTSVCDYNDLVRVGRTRDVRQRGYNPFAWAVAHSVLPLCDLSKFMISKQLHEMFADEDTRNNILFAFLSSARKEKPAAAQVVVECFLKELTKDHPWKRSPSQVQRANKHRNTMYTAVTNEEHPEKVQDILTKLNLLPSSAADVEPTLLQLLHTACCIGDVRKFSLVLKFLKTFPTVWNGGELLNKPLEVVDGVQYAVQVAAEHQCMEILHSLAKYPHVNFLINNAIAVRRAIVHRSFEAAEWILSHSEDTTTLERFPSLEHVSSSSSPSQVPIEEVEFCFRKKLLPVTYFEEYLANSAYWESRKLETDDTSSNVKKRKTALMLVDIQNDFFQGGSLPCANATKQYAANVAEFVKKMAPVVSVIAIAKDWHPDGHFSFVQSHPNLNGIRVITDPQSGQQQHLWERHCVQGTPGAAVHHVVKDALEGVKNLVAQFEVLNGQNKHVDSYSTFFDNNRQEQSTMHTTLKDEYGIDHIIMLGIATVGYSAVDALSLGGFEVTVVKDLCVAVDEEQGKAMLDEINRRGGSIRSSVELIPHQTTSSLSPPPTTTTTPRQSTPPYDAEQATLAKTIMSFPELRYHALFPSKDAKERMFSKFNNIDFGFENPREGELFLTLAGFMNTLKQEFKFTLHGLTFNKPYGVTETCLRYPLHCLMVVSKYAVEAKHRQCATELAVSVVKFINKNHSYDKYDQARYRIPGPYHPDDIMTLHEIARQVPRMCTLDSTTCTTCIFHAHNNNSTTTRSDGSGGMYATRQQCSVTGARHQRPDSRMDGEHLQHVVLCTPLQLAVRLRLTSVVEAMVLAEEGSTPMVGGDFLEGRDINGDRYAFQDMYDIWGAVNHTRITKKSHVPPFHFLMRSLRPILEGDIDYEHGIVRPSSHTNEYIAIQDPPESVSPVITHIFHPGCGVDPRTADEITDKEKALKPNRDSVRIGLRSLRNFIDSPENLHRGGGKKISIVGANSSFQSVTLDVIYEWQEAGATVLHEETVQLDLDLLTLQFAPRAATISDQVATFLSEVRENMQKNTSQHSVEKLIEELTKTPSSPSGLTPHHEDGHWSIPYGLQWMCPECGAYLYEIEQVDWCSGASITANMMSDAVEAIEIARIFLRANSRYERPLTINGLPAGAVHIDKDTFFSKWVDMAGLWVMSGAHWNERRTWESERSSGIAMVFACVPYMVPELLELNVFQTCPL
eukprot:PhF_6_TR15948/c0_g1_i3/m.24808